MEGHDQAVAPIFLLVLLLANATFGAYQSAGCSDEGCGIPCYLRPAGDTCHYTRDDSASGCCDGSEDYLKKELWTLNSSLIRLQNKLIQKGIIPAGDNCRSLPDVDHGGVIYSDLLISTGVTAMYMCEEGYTLHGHGKYECGVDGVWSGNDTGQLPTCEDSMIVCAPLVNIPNGHISYTLKDGTLVKPGDLVLYSCDELYSLEGSSYRVCLGNGTWTGKEPICAAPATTEPSSMTDQRTDQQVPVTVGTIFGVIGGLVLLVVTGGVIITIGRKKCRKGYKNMREDVNCKVTSAPKEERQSLVETVH